MTGKNYCLCLDCEHFKAGGMDFFEAWQKAEVGDTLAMRGEFFCKKKEFSVLQWDTDEYIKQRTLFFKEWTIIPKKKKVTKTIVIPEGEMTVCFKSGHEALKKRVAKITYEIEEEGE
jgi:hypothetical protein